MRKMNLGVAWLIASVAVGLLAASVLRGQGTTPNTVTGAIYDVIREASTYVDARSLAANTAETVTVPSFANSDNQVVAIFSATCASYYVNVTTTASVPAADVTNGSASERNPSALTFDEGDTFSLVTPDTCTVTIAWYRGRR